MQTLVVVGISGDLARRKLLPALRSLKRQGALPIARIIGTTRRELEVGALLVQDDPLMGMLEVRRLDDVRGIQDGIFYLAVPPGTAPSVAAELAGANTGVLALEKPFGHDAASAQAEAQAIHAAFAPERVYRVDHYLAKPLVSRLAVLSPQGAPRVEVMASEQLGAGERIGFYEATGALRDFGNHLLSLLAVALGAQGGPERTEFLKRLSVESAVRGQYQEYEDELRGQSQTETLVALSLRDAACPSTKLVLATGKALAAKETCIYIGGPGGGLCELSDDADAYSRVFEALFARERALFLTEEEIAESWRIMDEARQAWGPLTTYERGAPLGSVLKQLGF